MESSGSTQGPPEPVQPGPALRVTSRPRRSASLTTCLKRARHSGLMNSTGPRGTPTLTSQMTTPPRPAARMASRSAVMPSRVRLPSIHIQ